MFLRWEYPALQFFLRREIPPDNVPQKYFSPPFMNGGREIFLFYRGKATVCKVKPSQWAKIYSTPNRFNAALASASPCSAALRYQLTACV